MSSWSVPLQIKSRLFPHSCTQRHQLDAWVDKYSDLYEIVYPSLVSHFFKFAHWSVINTALPDSSKGPRLANSHVTVSVAWQWEDVLSSLRQGPFDLTWTIFWHCLDCCSLRWRLSMEWSEVYNEKEGKNPPVSVRAFSIPRTWLSRSLEQAKFAVIWVSPRFGHPHSQNPSDMGIPFSYYLSDLS